MRASSQPEVLIEATLDASEIGTKPAHKIQYGKAKKSPKKRIINRPSDTSIRDSVTEKGITHGAVIINVDLE